MQPEAPFVGTVGTILNAPDDTVVALPKRRGGRPPGSKNKRTREVEAVMRPMVPRVRRRLMRLLEDEDAELALRASQLILGYCYGTPTQRKEITGANGGPVATVSAVAQFDPIAIALDFAKQLGRPLKPAVEHALIERGAIPDADNDQ